MRTSDPDFEEGTLNPYVLAPGEVQLGDQLGYKLVAKVHEGMPYWTVYRGSTGWSDERIANEGDAVPEEVARAVFPVLANTKLVYYA
jgi:hypothetical protein